MAASLGVGRTQPPFVHWSWRKTLKTPSTLRPLRDLLSRFGGSAWKWNEGRQQYYCHTFLVEQPDLNWRNEQVRKAIAEVMRFWLSSGIDGFRVDASAVLIKDNLLRNNPPNEDADDNVLTRERNIPVLY